MSQLSKAASEAIVKGMKRPMLIDGPDLDKLRRDREELLEALKAIVWDLPLKRDWLDPVIERQARAAIRKAEEGE